MNKSELITATASVGFGSFDVKDRTTRQARKLQTGKPMTISAKKAPVFKAVKGLKDSVNTSSVKKNEKK